MCLNSRFSKIQSHIKFYLGMDDNSSNRALTKQNLLISKSFAVSGVLVAMFDNHALNTILSNAESREEQDGGKQYFVG